MNASHYVYVHRRATDRSVFYVGKGKDRRAWDRQGRNRHWRHIVQKHGFEVEVIKATMPEACALSLERALIAALGREHLANVVDGGGGTSGWKHSPETRARIGAFHKGRKPTAKMIALLSSCVVWSDAGKNCAAK